MFYYHRDDDICFRSRDMGVGRNGLQEGPGALVSNAPGDGSLTLLLIGLLALAIVRLKIGRAGGLASIDLACLVAITLA